MKKYFFNKTFFITAFVLAGVFLFCGLALTAQESGQINVGMTVPTSGVLPPLDMIGPTISNIGWTAGYTTSTVFWVATDNVAVTNCFFNWGLTELYGQSAAWTASGSYGYTVNLTDLSTSTVYYFRITCQDAPGNTTATSSSFFTLSPFFQKKLLIKAKPEKRIYKTAGNLNLKTVLRLYHSITKEMVYEKAVILGATGTAMLEDSALPTGVFEAALKGESHLAKRMTGVVINNEQDANLDFTLANTFNLYAGDVQGTGLRDNFVDILDVSAEALKFNSADSVFDLNRDDIVDILDMSIVLVNYNKSGDAI